VTAKHKRVVHQKAKGPIDPVLGNRIRALREAAGLTQGDLAGDDFTKGFISLVETGRTRMSLRAAEIFAKRLGIMPYELFQIEPTKPLDGLADLSKHLLRIRHKVHDPAIALELERLAAEAARLAKRRTVSVEAVHQRRERAHAPLRELAQATA
jgi:transcriptional regulator with XRE-family HTH domain